MQMLAEECNSWRHLHAGV